MMYYKMWRIWDYMNPNKHDGICGSPGSFGAFTWRVFILAILAGLTVVALGLGGAALIEWLVDGYG